jgi:hypothetical protein
MRAWSTIAASGRRLIVNLAAGVAKGFVHKTISSQARFQSTREDGPTVMHPSDTARQEGFWQSPEILEKRLAA